MKAITIKNKKKLIRNIIILVVLLAAGGAVAFFQIKAANAPAAYETVEAVRGDLEQNLSASGQVKSENIKTYYADVDAPISEVFVKEGDTIKSGISMLSYDTSDLEREKEKAELDRQVKSLELQVQTEKGQKEAAEYAQATANIAVLDAQIAALEGEIEQVYGCITANTDWRENTGAALQDEIGDIEKDISKLDTEIEAAKEIGGAAGRAEVKKLKKKKGKKEDALDEKREEARSHTNTDLENYLRQKQDELTKLKELKADNETEQKSSEDGILTGTQQAMIGKEREVAKTAEVDYQTKIDKASAGVTSEFGGIVTDVKVNPGAVVQGGTELFTVQDDSKVKVSLQVSRFDLEYISIGQEADLTIAGREYKGKITHIDRAASTNESGSSVIFADIHVENPDENIYLGVEAKATVHVAEKKDALLLPVEVINMDADGYYCYVIRNGLIERADLEIGIASDTMTEILSGVEEGDQIIIGADAELLVPGSEAVSTSVDDAAAEGEESEEPAEGETNDGAAAASEE